eukprot:TRINITY_DN3433_c0_g2_i3.p1 TRINITY_DN3433_c0_g2~~TRINITY_DN3433_c0_g2_i3.p1  ORF type:complete len:207 (-),score=54.36 TRINITY_DN3433_c0_g2_i3:175-795(-)
MRKKFLKIMVLGDAGVGKTAILDRYVNEKFTGKYKVTIGADFLTRDLEINGSKIKLQIWDTAGQEKYKSLGKAYYRGSDACILVFDLCDKTTFKHLDDWLDIFLSQLAEDKAKHFPLVLFGNKADKAEREVTTETARRWCSFHDGMAYYETSAKTKQGLDEAFVHIAELAMKIMQAQHEPIRLRDGKIHNGIRRDQPQSKSKENCC